MKGRVVRRQPPSLDQVRSFYESDVVIDRFNSSFAGQWHIGVDVCLPGATDVEQLLCQMLRLTAEHHLLDFGAGPGTTTCFVAAHTGCRARGLNISAKQVGIANELALRMGLSKRVAFDLYAGRAFPYPDATFDRAVFFESPCHVPHKELLFRELLRVLKPGGSMFGQDWALTTDVISPADLERTVRPIEVSVEVELRSLEGYRTLMTEAGFRNVQALDARDVATDLDKAFTAGTADPIEVTRREAIGERLSKGNIALSNAYHRGLFTIGFFYGERPLEGPGRSASGSRVSSEPRGRLMSAEEQTLEIFSRRKNLACMEFHRAAFGVPESEALHEFARLVDASACCTLESSCKVSPRGVQSARWNLFCHGEDKEAFLASGLRLFERLAGILRAPLDTGLVHRFLDVGIDFREVRKVVVGVDLQEEVRRSRLKLWFMLANAPASVNRAVALHGDDEAVSALRVHGDFLVGFDLRLDGTSGIKLYPDILPEELRDPDVRKRLGGFLSPRSTKVMEDCLWTHIYIAAHNADLVLQLHPADPDGFVRRYLPPRAKSIHAAYGGIRLLDMVVSVPEGELRQGPVENFTLYYMPATSPLENSATGH